MTIEGIDKLTSAPGPALHNCYGRSTLDQSKGVSNKRKDIIMAVTDKLIPKTRIPKTRIPKIRNSEGIWKHQFSAKEYRGQVLQFSTPQLFLENGATFKT